MKRSTRISLLAVASATAIGASLVVLVIKAMGRPRTIS